MKRNLGYIKLPTEVPSDTGLVVLLSNFKVHYILVKLIICFRIRSRPFSLG